MTAKKNRSVNLHERIWLTKLLNAIQNFDTPHPRFPGKTVYILGAGFSAPMGMPVMPGFISAGLQLLKEHGWTKSSATRARARMIQDIVQLTDRYLPLFAASDTDEPTLEDLFSVVDMFAIGPNQPSSKQYSQSERRLLCEFVRSVCFWASQRHADKMEWVKRHDQSHEWVPTLGQRFFHNAARTGQAGEVVLKSKSEVCAYEAFLSQIIAANKKILAPDKFKEMLPDFVSSAVICLNYDNVIEQKAVRFGKDLRLFYGDSVVDGQTDKDVLESLNLIVERKPSAKGGYSETLLPLIKLHGSLNWTPTNVAGKPDSKSYDKRSSQGKLTVRVLPDSGESDGQLVECLIYPTWQRDPLNETVFSKLLHQARVHLRLASRIVIIGYSLPATDRYLNYLLADAVSTPELPGIEICNRGEEAHWRDRARAFFGNRIVAANKLVVRTGGFEDHVRAYPDPNALPAVNAFS